MATIKRFEDLLSWQKAHALTRLVYQVSRQDSFSKDKALREQIQRAAVSIGANIAEGFHRRGDKEFHQFLAQAKGSVGEVRALAYSADAADYLRPEQLKEIAALTAECERLIEGHMRYLRESGHKKPAPEGKAKKKKNKEEEKSKG